VVELSRNQQYLQNCDTSQETASLLGLMLLRCATGHVARLPRLLVFDVIALIDYVRKLRSVQKALLNGWAEVTL